MTAAPTPRELEERVASAMWALMYPDHPWDAGEYVGKDMYRLQAKAALAVVREALREPTPEMKQAGWIDKEDVDPEDIWCAMFDFSCLGGQP